MEASQQSLAADVASGLFKTIKRVIISTVILGLASMNVATLLNDSIHTAGFEVLQRLLGTVLPEVAASRLLKHSPTVVRRGDVERATVKIRRDLTDLDEKHRDLTSKHVKLEKNHNELSTKHNALQAKSAKQAESVHRITSRMSKRTLVAATRNSTSVVGEAIPVVGIGLMLGVTAWDLYDFCEYQKDISELQTTFDAAPDSPNHVCGMKVPSKDQVITSVVYNWQSAYKSTANALNEAGRSMVSPTIPAVSWTDVKQVICPITGTNSPFC